MEKERRSDSLSIRPIGYIQSPYKDWAPYQPVEREEEIGNFQVHVNEEYSEGLKDLEHFAYVILIFYCDRAEMGPELTITLPWTKKKVGLFASRSPERPNPIGISIVRIHKIEGNVIYTWPIDVFDGTPLLDIKPYIATLDSKADANDGWVDGLEGKEHLLQHVRGIPHNHSEGRHPGHEKK